MTDKHPAPASASVATLKTGMDTESENAFIESLFVRESALSRFLAAACVSNQD